ncbi:HD domain-containing protein [bacterium]|nr:MAG: HD domain-containing protein [bacterium]
MPQKSQFIGKLHEDSEVHDTFLVLQKQLSPTRQGRSYLRVTLGDKSGQLEARVWEGAEELASRFESGDLVFVTGVVTSYQGVIQIKAQYIEKVEDPKVDWSAFLPSSKRPVAEMQEELKGLLLTIENPFLKRLTESFVEDGEFFQRFSLSPAAKGMHHAYIGGLIEHTIGVIKAAIAIADLYPAISRDILVTGAFLHDIGKTEELEATAGFDYTIEGKLLGHIIIGRDMLIQKAAAIEGFPAKLLTHLEHMILSHHGELEWGSPKRPKTVESLALHIADNIDAKLMAALDSVEKPDGTSGEWTSFLKIFERPFLRPFALEDDSTGGVSQKQKKEANAKKTEKQAEQKPTGQRTLF